MPRKTSPKLLKIVASADLKKGRSVKFVVPRGERRTEAFLIQCEGEYRAYLNLCRHWTVGLDFDDNDFFSEDGEWLVCKNHGALYRPETGECASGPCNGAALYRVPVLEKGGFIWAKLDEIDWGD